MNIIRLRVINNCSVTTAASFDTFTFLDLFYLDGSNQK